MNMGKGRAVLTITAAGVCLVFLAGDKVLGNSSEAALRDFGSQTGEAIHQGFLFLGGRYIEAPYFVERRGLDIFINGFLVRRGPKYSPTAQEVTEDPGDPPSGSSPIPEPGTRRRDTFWKRKWEYLSYTFDYPVAVRKMLETYGKSTEVRSVEIDPSDGIDATVTLKSGRAVPVTFLSGSRTGRQDKDGLLTGAETSMQHFGKRLRAGSLIMTVSGCEMILGREMALDMLQVLTSSEDGETRRRLLEQKGLLMPNDPIMGLFATQFEGSEQLVRRVEVLERMASAAKNREAAERILGEMEAVDLDLP
jgi:hypothetical protein